MHNLDPVILLFLPNLQLFTLIILMISLLDNYFEQKSHLSKENLMF